MNRRLCRCGHGRAIHTHYRAGTDCAHTGCGCPRYGQTLIQVWNRWWNR